MHIRRILAAFFVLSLALCAAFPAAAETFTNPYHIQTSTTPSSVAVGDLNGDGLPDIVWGQKGVTPNLVHVLLAQAGGGYAPAPVVSLPNLVTAYCRLFDTNRDGKLDLVCPYENTFNASIVVFPGNGDGTFAAPVFTALPTSYSAYFDATFSPPMDLNGDGIPDLIVFDQDDQHAYIMVGDGHSDFHVASTLNYPPGGIPIPIDLNGDGKIDLAFPDGPSVLLGNGDGTFGLPHTYSQTFDYDNICVFADMDGDGHPDAVCGYVETQNGGDIDGATHLIILHGNGDGSFNPTPIVNQQFGNHDTEYDGMGTFLEPIAVADLNGDNVLDVISASSGGYGVLLGEPDLAFAAPKHYVSGSIATPGSFTATFADMNGDGLPDIVATGAGGIYISYGRKDGTFTTARAFEVAQSLDNAAFADFNGDGNPDVVATGDTSIQISLSNGDGTFKPFTAVPNNGINFSGVYPGADATILAGDFNGDHRQDILALGLPSFSNPTDNDLYVFFGNGDGTFQQPLQVPGSSSSGSTLTDTFIADVNKDGRDDIVSAGDFGSPLAGQAPEIYVSLSNGDGSFNTVATVAPIEVLNSAFDANIFGIALADFDHHGKLDAAIIEQVNAYVLKGHGDGGFDSTGTVLAIPPIPGRTTEGTANIVAGDFDGDGNPDVALLINVSDPNSSFLTNGTAVLVYYGKGDGTFTAPVIAAEPDHTYTEMQAADLNGDGLADIILRNPGQGYESPAVGILHAAPGRTFTAEVNYVAAGALGAIAGLNQAAVVDVNRDGYPDLLFANNLVSGSPANTVAVLLNQPQPAVTGALVASPEPSLFGQTFTLTATLTPPAPGLLTGSVAFSIDGVAVGASALANNAATLTIPGTLSAGQHTVVATWPGDSTYQTISLSDTHLVLGLSTTTTLTSSLNPALFGTVVTLTATVTGTSGTPTGNITFYDGALVLAIVTLDASGHAAFTTSTLAVGSHPLTAAYAGSSTYAASASPAIVEVIQPLPQDFTITLATPSITIQTQHHATTTLTLASVNGFADSLAITCTNLPQYITCQPTPSSATLAANATATVSLYFDTDSVVGYARNTPAAPPGRHAPPLALALLFPFGFFASLAFSRTPRRLSASLRLLALLLALLPLSLALAGCGEIILASDPPPSAAPGTYTIPITAIGATTHISHTVNLNLTVTP